MAIPNRGVINTNSTRSMKSEFVFCSGESFSSDSGSDEITSEESYKFQKQLPMKKRHFGIPDKNDSLEEHQNHWAEKHQKFIKNPETEGNNLLKRDPKKAKILPGVIRHTSCPHSTLAYYYDYSFK